MTHERRKLPFISEIPVAVSTDSTPDKPTLDIDQCAAQLAAFVRESSPQISGPHEIAYGMRWYPSISYWIGRRRVHLYEDTRGRFTAEIADRSDRQDPVSHRCHVTSVDEIRDIMDRFLCGNWPIETLTGIEWFREHRDSDKFIPDPPNRANPANIAESVGLHCVPDGPPALQRGAIEYVTRLPDYGKSPAYLVDDLVARGGFEQETAAEMVEIAVAARNKTRHRSVAAYVLTVCADVLCLLIPLGVLAILIVVSGLGVGGCLLIAWWALGVVLVLFALLHGLYLIVRGPQGVRMPIG